VTEATLAALPEAAVPAAAVEAPLLFTGVGGEYFRVWVVNATLSLATLD
jgi:uncharacterized membrane protein YjgN (DUF898 family)